jgi:hypothetical protein
MQHQFRAFAALVWTRVYFKGWKKIAAEGVSAALGVRENARFGVWLGLG